MISVIIPVYNAEQYLPTCLESVLKQTFNDFEIILVDDGSKDNSLEICLKYQQTHKNIKVVSKNNEGPGLTRQRGMDESNGEYIAFVDSDDWVEPTYLEKMYKALIEHDVDLVRCNCALHYGKTIKYMWNPDFCNNVLNRQYIENVVIPLMIAPEKESDYNKRLGRGCVCMLFSKNLIADNQIQFGNLLSGEDALFTMELFLNCQKIMFIDDYLYHYIHQNPKSLSQNIQSVNKEQRRKKRESLLKMVKGLDSFSIIEERLKQEDRKSVFLDLRIIVLHSSDTIFGEKMRSIRSLLKNEDTIAAFKNIRLRDFKFKIRSLYFLIKYRFSLLLYMLIRIRGK